MPVCPVCPVCPVAREVAEALALPEPLEAHLLEEIFAPDNLAQVDDVGLLEVLRDRLRQRLRAGPRPVLRSAAGLRSSPCAPARCTGGWPVARLAPAAPTGHEQGLDARAAALVAALVVGVVLVLQSPAGAGGPVLTAAEERQVGRIRSLLAAALPLDAIGDVLRCADAAGRVDLCARLDGTLRAHLDAVEKRRACLEWSETLIRDVLSRAALPPPNLGGSRPAPEAHP